VDLNVGAAGRLETGRRMAPKPPRSRRGTSDRVHRINGDWIDEVAGAESPCDFPTLGDGIKAEQRVGTAEARQAQRKETYRPQAMDGDRLPQDDPSVADRVQADVAEDRECG
jgi:hypothetical protein